MLSLSVQHGRCPAVEDRELRGAEADAVHAAPRQPLPLGPAGVRRQGPAHQVGVGRQEGAHTIRPAGKQADLKTFKTKFLLRIRGRGIKYI